MQDSNPTLVYEILHIERPRNFAAPSAPARSAAFWHPAPRSPQHPCQPWNRAACQGGRRLRRCGRRLRIRGRPVGGRRLRIRADPAGPAGRFMERGPLVVYLQEPALALRNRFRNMDCSTCWQGQGCLRRIGSRGLAILAAESCSTQTMLHWIMQEV